MNERHEPNPTPNEAIPATDWRLIDHAKLEQEDRERLNEFILDYYKPLDRFLAGAMGIIDHDLRRDLLQSFMLEKVATRDLFRAATASKGRFRSLVLCSLANYCRNKMRDRARAPLHTSTGLDLVAGKVDLDRFEKAWAEELLTAAQARMIQSCRDNAEDRVLEVWHSRSGLDKPVEPVRTLADRLGVADRTIKRDFKRARKLHERAIRAELADQVGNDPKLIKEALADIWRIVGG